MTLDQEALELHELHRGKMETNSRVVVDTPRDLALAYTPGVAAPSRAIAADPELVFRYTNRGNLVGVVSDGTAVLGLGDVGPLAALPVMEGKAVLFKVFAGLDAFPLCLDTRDPDRLIVAVKLLAPSLGGVNLEDIRAPACFGVEERLRAELDIPVFHDDQHGTAIVVLAALLNALCITRRRIQHTVAVVGGAGAAGVAVTRMLLAAGLGDVRLCDREGLVFPGRTRGMNPYKAELAARTNHRQLRGSLAQALEGADVFVGVSGPGLVTRAMVESMNVDPVVFALANPEPEIQPEEARAGGARVVGTGRSDHPNQINNVLAFPGVMRGAMEARARDINQPMYMAAAEALARLVSPAEREEGKVVPSPFDRRVAPAVAAAVAGAACETGVARVEVEPDQVAERTRRLARSAGPGPGGEGRE